MQFLKTVLSLLFLLPIILPAQTTTGYINGSVQTNTGQLLANCIIKLVHEPTATVYFSKTTKQGLFSLDNINPGGPYQIEASFLGFQTDRKKSVIINLGETVTIDFILSPQTTDLGNIQVNSRLNLHLGTDNLLNQDKINTLPAFSRNLADYLKTIPQAKLMPNTEGGISFAGQNNRYNAFYVDGAVNNDVFGLTTSGTNGGQAGIAPLSIDAIDQFQVAISSYDVSMGNFTGGSINAITKMGTNKTAGSVYHFFSNQHISGKKIYPENSLAKIDFGTNLLGARMQGAIKKNTCFYFISMEMQRDQYPKPFSANQYSGNTKDPAILQILGNTLRSTYHYEPGNFLTNVEMVHADRIAFRLDWNLGRRSKLSVSNRYTLGQRSQTNSGNATTIHFSNDGYLLKTSTHSMSLEWKTIIGKHTGNKLLLTYTSVADKRLPMGKAFPRVRINDGDGAIIFGTDINATHNLLRQKNLTFFDKLNFIKGTHLINLGVDISLSNVTNFFIQNGFGSYSFSSLSNFLTNAHPSAYQLGFPLSDSGIQYQQESPARFSVVTAALFINDAIKLAPHILVQVGIRADYTHFLTSPMKDDFINQVAIPAYEKYWDVQGAIAGRVPTIPITISPRIGFVYQSNEKKMSIKGGMGLFTGRIPLAWPGGIYTNNGKLVGGYKAVPAELNRMRFRANPFNQWTIAETGATLNKEPINLIAKKFYMPSLFRTSLALEKKLGKGWTVSLEGIFSKNIQEIAYTNVNLLPAADSLLGPDNRFVYSIINNGRVPLKPDGSNPYDYAILLGNNQKEKGYSTIVTFSLAKKNPLQWNWELQYTTGKSITMNDGSASINASQWRFMESVNGRNFLTTSISDFSMGHRLFAWAEKKIKPANKKRGLSITLIYHGQSGSPFSYVYGDGSITRDDGMQGSYDLIYIPTEKDLTTMPFLENTIEGITYTAQDQRVALEKFISRDPYLKNRRGNYAERNGSTTPFIHKIDLKIKQDFTLKLGKYHYLLQVSWDFFNLSNLINSGWGLHYQLPFDQFPLINFAGFAGSNLYQPLFRFNPTLLEKGAMAIQTGNPPPYASNWSSQIGVRLVFNE